MFEMAIGEDSATAHDVFVAMQEIPFILKTQGTPESKLLALQEIWPGHLRSSGVTMTMPGR